jgi:hypothetical protein
MDNMLIPPPHPIKDTVPVADAPVPTKLARLLAHEVTRKQFLGMTLTSVAGLFGLASIIGLLGPAKPDEQGPVNYGRRDYGP